MKYTIIYDPNPSSEVTKILWEGISKNAMRRRGLESGKAFGYFLKDDKDNIKGGCSGYLFYGCLYVDLLWIDESLRGKKFGTDLMHRVETLAKENRCRFIVVNTMDFEAPDFYKKLGFYIEFERRGFDTDAVFYFLRKDL